MPRTRSFPMITIVPLAVAAAVCLGLAASAAPDAGAKASGSYNFYGSSAHHSFSSARGHVESYQSYLRDTHGVAMPAPAAGGPVASAAPVAVAATSRPVDVEVARDVSDAIGDDIERIQRHLDQMRKRAEAAVDKDVLAIIASVEKNLGVARRSHAALHEHHAEETIAPHTAMELAHKVNESLRAAHAEHDRLMARLREAR